MNHLLAVVVITLIFAIGTAAPAATARALQDWAGSRFDPYSPAAPGDTAAAPNRSTKYVFR